MHPPTISSKISAVIKMMESTFKVPDDDDLEFVFILQSLGMQRNVAVLITYLGSAGETTSREIEQATGLRQPEVSIAMQGLRAQTG